MVCRWNGGRSCVSRVSFPASIAILPLISFPGSIQSRSQAPAWERNCYRKLRFNDSKLELGNEKCARYSLPLPLWEGVGGRVRLIRAFHPLPIPLRERVHVQRPRIGVIAVAPGWCAILPHELCYSDHDRRVAVVEHGVQRMGMQVCQILFGELY